MRHAIYLPPFGSFGDVHALVDLAAAAEEAGWDGFFTWDHIQFAEPVPMADAWIALSAIASATSTIRLGPLVTPLARRRPWKVAREAVTLDHLSRGRLVLGVGLGIDFWGEFSSFSGEVTSDAERAALVDDGIEIIDRLWSGQPVSYDGAALSVDAAPFLPRPVQQPRIPIWAALLWPARRDGPIARAARCDGVYPFGGGAPITPSDAVAVRDAVAAIRGDEPFDLCVNGVPGRVRRYEEAGVTWLTRGFGPDESLAEARAVIAAGPPDR